MHRIFRPSVLIAVSVALVVAAAFVFRVGPAPSKPVPLAVKPGETEVVWLYPATSTGAWERFVDAVDLSSRRLQSALPGLRVEGRDVPARQATTAVAQLALTWPRGRRLVFRWYKLTGDWKTRDWVEALLRRRPPPLAIIGGSDSYWARELAIELQIAGSRLANPSTRPVLLLTYATADRVRRPEESRLRRAGITPGGPDDPFAHLPKPEADEEQNPRLVGLHELYPDRTFRFCFTNTQMARAITRFIWSRPELRPDADPAYMVQWDDDSYSRDLVGGPWGGYWRALRRRVQETAAPQWAGRLAGCIGLSGLSPGLGAAGYPAQVAAWQAGSNFGLDPDRGALHVLRNIESSVGPFFSPNPFEAREAGILLDQVPAGQRRPLLIVTGQAQPSRRFLRYLARSAPDAARRFVVATGDAVSFNIVYRDRQVTWPIQDLPFDLVFFCHQNPVDPHAGFREAPGSAGGAQERSAEQAKPAGTEDLLLYTQLVEALALAFAREGRPATDGEELAGRLHELCIHQGRLDFSGPEGTRLFRPGPGERTREHAGERRTGTGEHAVYLRPTLDGERVLPRAAIEVWAWQAEGGRRGWEPRRKEPLIVSYDESQPGGGPHAGE
jgi:hypothetical protein